jgi:hypothetical protein
VGVWGTALFSDDTAADTRDAFTDFVADGLTPEEATERLIAESSDILADEGDAGVFWLALAATQWKLGRLIDSVRDRALEIISSGADLRRWQQSPKAEMKRRKKHLSKLRDQLLSPQPKPKKLRPGVKSSTEFQAGDVAAFRLDERIAIRFCVLHLWSDRGGTYADICLLGLDDGTPFTKANLELRDMLGPHYSMLSHEPADRITMLRRHVGLPKRDPEAFRAWYNLPVRGHACTWDDFPEALQRVLPVLGWLPNNLPGESVT